MQKRRKLLVVGTIIVFVTVFTFGWVSGIAKQALAAVTTLEGIENPIARTLLQKFFPNPNLLAEDHVEISCEPEFSVKAFTGATLVNAAFTVKDAATGATLFGPKVVSKIDPLWQKVWLGPLSSIPPKIQVVMDAQTSDGEPVSHKLIVEPDCKRPGGVITEKVVILWPRGKLLINPSPPFAPPLRFPSTLPQPPEPPRFFDIPLTVAVPQEAVGQDLITAVVWRNPETGVRQYLSAMKSDITTEILQLNLRSLWPSQLAPRDSLPASSFFDVLVEIESLKADLNKDGKVDDRDIKALEEIGNLIADVMVRVGRGDVVTVEEPRRLISTFDEAYFGGDLRVINAAPLEPHCPLDDDCDEVFDSTDNCPGAANPDQTDSDLDGLGDACDSCPNDAINDCRASDGGAVVSPAPNGDTSAP